jgi:hypothetical protein
MTKELIGGALMLGIIGICWLGVVWYQAVAECAKDSAEFPDQGEAEEAKQ